MEGDVTYDAFHKEWTTIYFYTYLNYVTYVPSTYLNDVTYVPRYVFYLRLID